MSAPGWRRREIHRRTNTIRATHGLPPLARSWRLTRAAVHYAADMNRTGVFDHTSADGRTWLARLAAVADPSPGGENIAWGQPTPTAVMAAWMASPAHRANILRPGFRRLGVGYHRGRDTWVCDFGY